MSDKKVGKYEFPKSISGIIIVEPKETKQHPKTGATIAVSGGFSIEYKTEVVTDNTGKDHNVFITKDEKVIEYMDNLDNSPFPSKRGHWRIFDDKTVLLTIDEKDDEIARLKAELENKASQSKGQALSLV